MVAVQSPKTKGEPFTAGRLAKGTSLLLQECVDNVFLEGELRQLPHVLEVDRAHLVMLVRQGLMSRDQSSALMEQVDALAKAGPENFTGKPGYGTLNLQIEDYLVQKLDQDTAGRLPIGRSRIDHGATVRRVSDRQSLLKVERGLLSVLEALSTTAEKHADTAIISFTHMQQAQPTTFGHYLLAFFSRLKDCFEQVSQVYERMNRSPLGAVGLSGTELPIDRRLTASLLGFPALVENSLTGRDAYYQIEIASALSMIMTILNDLCTDLHIHSSSEYGYVELDDSHCSTSSIFPQKKNPVALEAVKLKAAESHGWVMAAFSIFRNEGTADQYYRSVPVLPSACQTTADMLHLTAEIVQGLTVNKVRCEEQLGKAWVTTSRLGNTLLLKHGVDFRTAHTVVGRLVKICVNRGLSPTDVDVALFQEAANQMGQFNISPSQEELARALDYKCFLQDCKSAGGVGKQEFERLLRLSQDQLLNSDSWLEGKELSLATARKALNEAGKKLSID